MEKLLYFAGWIAVVAFVIFAGCILYITLFEPAPRRRFPRTLKSRQDYLHDTNSPPTLEEKK